jgi:DNA polymerase V
MYALVDGNNFYVSCQRVFHPSLVGRPGYFLMMDAIARVMKPKQEIKMGQPVPVQAL